MWEEIFNLAINNGLWAVLFLVLLVYVLKDSRAREKKYQDTIEKLGKTVTCVENIKESVEEIKEIIDKKLKTKKVQKERSSEKV